MRYIEFITNIINDEPSYFYQYSQILEEISFNKNLDHPAYEIIISDIKTRINNLKSNHSFNSKIIDRLNVLVRKNEMIRNIEDGKIIL